MLLNTSFFIVIVVVVRVPCLEMDGSIMNLLMNLAYHSKYLIFCEFRNNFCYIMNELALVNNVLIYFPITNEIKFTKIRIVPVECIQTWSRLFFISSIFSTAKR